MYCIHNLLFGSPVIMICLCCRDVYTVEPLTNGHFGDEYFVHCSEVVPSSEVEIGRGRTVCRLQGGCPLFRVSVIRDCTVYQLAL